MFRKGDHSYQDESVSEEVRQEWRDYVRVVKANGRARKRGKPERPLPVLSDECRQYRTEAMASWRRRKKQGDL